MPESCALQPAKAGAGIREAGAPLAVPRFG